METCEHPAVDLRLCPGDTAESWRIVRGGLGSGLVLGRCSWSPGGECIRRETEVGSPGEGRKSTRVDGAGLG